MGLLRVSRLIWVSIMLDQLTVKRWNFRKFSWFCKIFCFRYFNFSQFGLYYFFLSWIVRKVLCANWPGSRKERGEMGARRPFWIGSQKWALGRQSLRKINGYETDGTWEEILSCLWGKSLRALTFKIIPYQIHFYTVLRWMRFSWGNFPYFGQNQWFTDR